MDYRSPQQEISSLL